LGQVLANLLDNAVRYSPEGGTISVSARGRSRAVEITVADDGIGISEPDQHRVFAKFFRSERAPAGPGSGLGLFLVRGLVTAMGGRVWLESEEGGGSRFTVELPLTGAAASATAPVETAAS
jgi:signal transduction histidine kinase